MSDPKNDAKPAAKPADGPRKPIEHWQAARGVAPWKHLGAARHHGWGVGRELTETEYLNGCDAFASSPVEA